MNLPSESSAIEMRLRALKERTESLQPSRDLMARLQAIPTSSASSGWSSFFSAITHYALPSLAIAAVASIVIAWAAPSAEASFDDDLASATAMEIVP